MGRRQLSKAGFKTYLIACVNLRELNSETPAGLVSDAIYDATHRGKVSSRMCNLERDSAGPLWTNDSSHGSGTEPIRVFCEDGDARLRGRWDTFLGFPRTEAARRSSSSKSSLSL